MQIVSLRRRATVAEWLEHSFCHHTLTVSIHTVAMAPKKTMKAKRAMAKKKAMKAAAESSYSDSEESEEEASAMRLWEYRCTASTAS